MWFWSCDYLMINHASNTYIRDEGDRELRLHVTEPFFYERIKLQKMP